MKRKQAIPDCVMCKGTGRHPPILVGPVDPVEYKKALASLPDEVECGCTFEWEAHAVSGVKSNNGEAGE